MAVVVILCVLLTTVTVTLWLWVALFFTMRWFWFWLKLKWLYESWLGCWVGMYGSDRQEVSIELKYVCVGCVHCMYAVYLVCEKRKEKKQSWCKHRNTTQESVFSMRCSCSPSLSQELLHFSSTSSSQLDHIMGLYLVEYCQSMFAISAGSCCTLALYMHTYILYKKQKFKYKNIIYLPT